MFPGQRLCSHGYLYDYDPCKRTCLQYQQSFYKFFDQFLRWTKNLTRLLAAFSKRTRCTSRTIINGRTKYQCKVTSIMRGALTCTVLKWNNTELFPIWHKYWEFVWSYQHWKSQKQILNSIISLCIIYWQDWVLVCS